MAAAASIAKNSGGFIHSVKKWVFVQAGFNKYGLFHDDLLHETEDVSEAIRRLPSKIVHERNFRMVRAAQLSLQKIHLPEKEWISFEEDRANRYLQPYLQQVVKERMEKEQWEKEH